MMMLRPRSHMHTVHGLARTHADTNQHAGRLQMLYLPCTTRHSRGKRALPCGRVPAWQRHPALCEENLCHTRVVLCCIVAGLCYSLGRLLCYCTPKSAGELQLSGAWPGLAATQKPMERSSKRLLQRIRLATRTRSAACQHRRAVEGGAARRRNATHAAPSSRPKQDTACTHRLHAFSKKHAGNSKHNKRGLTYRCLEQGALACNTSTRACVHMRCNARGRHQTRQQAHYARRLYQNTQHAQQHSKTTATHAQAARKGNDAKKGREQARRQGTRARHDTARWQASADTYNPCVTPCTSPMQATRAPAQQQHGNSKRHHATPRLSCCMHVSPSQAGGMTRALPGHPRLLPAPHATCTLSGEPPHANAAKCGACCEQACASARLCTRRASEHASPACLPAPDAASRSGTAMHCAQRCHALAAEQSIQVLRQLVLSVLSSLLGALPSLPPPLLLPPLLLLPLSLP